MAKTRSRPDKLGGGWRSKLNLIGRMSVILLFGALLLSVTLQSSIANVFEFSRPDLALAWQPLDASASADLGQRLATADRGAEGQRLAERAIARSPLNVSAYSALALAAEARGDAGRAAQLMDLAHAMSRRDRITEMWLIQRGIATGDFDAAVRHFDIAMRTSAHNWEELLPLLVTATADPRSLVALGRTLDSEPAWKADFLLSVATVGPNLDSAVRLSRGRLDPTRPQERRILRLLIQRLLQERHFDIAWSVYREARPGMAPGAAATLRDTNYAGPSGFPPFDWELADQPDLGAYPERRRDGRPGPALVLAAEGGRTGEVARQLIQLPPGSYFLRFTAGAIPAGPFDRPRFSLSCSTRQEAIYEGRPAQGSADPVHVGGRFTVPSGCPWQFLSISVGSNETPVEFPWIADLTIRRAP